LIADPYGFTSTCPGLVPQTPCFLYYSRFTTKSSYYYAGTLIAFAVVSIVISLQQWVSYDILRKKVDLYTDNKKKYSRMFFNLYDWRYAKDGFEGWSQAASGRRNV